MTGCLGFNFVFKSLNNKLKTTYIPSLDRPWEYTYHFLRNDSCTCESFTNIKTKVFARIGDAGFRSSAFWLKKVENNQMENVLIFKILKNRYMKIHNIFLATKFLVLNDKDPLGEQSRNLWTQRSKRDRNAKNKVKKIKLEP